MLNNIVLNNKEKIRKVQKKYWEKNKKKLILQNRERYRKYYKDPENQKKIT
jgi:hypothetical protein